MLFCRLDYTTGNAGVTALKQDRLIQGDPGMVPHNTGLTVILNQESQHFHFWGFKNIQRDCQ